MADNHDHEPFIAHHFEDARQQYDAGKLGIWVFLVTEILFFSGLFVAYTLFRASNPDIYYEAHFHLDKILGGMNTIVLLFSSLTMAIAVRAAQLNQRKVLITNLAITMVCAAIFLGVKAVEYSHKWDMGILTRGYYNLDESVHHEGISKWLVTLSIVPGILLVVFAAAAVVYKVTDVPKKALFFGCLTLMMSGYFLGAVAGKVYMDATDSAKSHGGEHKESHAAAGHDSEAHDSEAHDSKAEGDKTEAEGDKTEVDKDKADKTKADKTKAGKSDGENEKSADAPATADGGATMATVAAPANPEDSPEAQSERKRRVGIFFSIYYCMTGLHAIHVIGGMIALSWLLWRSIRGDFRTDYFGPVDYVGLYWHIVDLIWIYLFPLLYLIN